MEKLWSLPYVMSLLLVAAPAGAGQSWQHLQGGRVLDVYAHDDLTAWTAEDGGRIRHTETGGQIWEFQQTPDSVRGALHGLDFLDDGQRGWAVGEHGVVLRTVNGGTNWRRHALQPVLDADDAPGLLHDAHFLDADHGWVVGENGVLSVTFDSGSTWADAGSQAGHSQGGYGLGERPPDYYAVHFRDVDTGFVVADQGLLLRTDDGGQSWEPARPPLELGLGPVSNRLQWIPKTVHFWEIAFVGQHGVVVGGIGNAEGWRLVTQDGGLSWRLSGCSALGGTPLRTQYGLTLFEDGAGLSSGYAGQVLAREGADEPCWTASPLDAGHVTTVPLRAVSGDGASSAWVVGEFGTIGYSADRGQTWVHQGNELVLRPDAVHFATDRIGLVAGQPERIAKTLDAGGSWTLVHIGQSGAHFRAVVLDLEQELAVAVGDVQVGSGGDPLLLVSHDAGDSWSASTWPSDVPPARLLDVTIAEDGVWVVGGQATILSSDDGGLTWTSRWVPAIADDLTAIAFDDQNGVGFLVGREGAWRSDDDGDSWAAVPVKDGEALWDISVLDDDRAWALGDGGVYRYDEESEGFLPVELPFELDGPLSSLQAVHSAGGDEMVEIFAVGSAGTILWFDGIDWSLPRSHSSIDLVDLSLLSEDEGFVVGKRSFTILAWR